MAINLELFACSGGMAEGFRRAGIRFELVIEIEADHCDSYETNLGHRPVQLDARDLLRLAELGARPAIDLLVADPPCTPWSRAGRRLGTADERDMLEVTCRLIAALRPRRYLIGNVPGLDDEVNLPITRRLIGGLSVHGYCTADYARLDAANYGVPQHRIRPFWFGHRGGSCIRWPAPTHCDPDELITATLPGIEPLKPWVTCAQALGHLEGEALGRPVRMRRRAQNGHQLGSVAERPARVVGRHRAPVHTSEADAPARAITQQCRAPGHATTIVVNERHAPAQLDAPAPTLGAKSRGQGGQVLAAPTSKRPAATPGEPASTVRAGGGGHSGPAAMLAAESGRQKRPSTQDPQSTRIISNGSPVLEWPWLRPSTTVTSRPGLAPPGHHDEGYALMSLPDAIILGERAAAILQGFSEKWRFAGRTKRARWSQIGQAMPPPLAEAVARAVVAQGESMPAEATL